jgi:hypothetical protein
MARTGLRMMPTFPSPPLKFRTAGFPQYGFKAGLSDGTFLQSLEVKPAPGIPSPHSSLSPSCACTPRLGIPGSVSSASRVSACHHSRSLRPSTPGVLGSGTSFVVSLHHRLYDPMRRSHRHAVISCLSTYTQRLRCAGAPTRPVGPSLLSLLPFPCVPPTVPRWSTVPLSHCLSNCGSRLPRFPNESPPATPRLCQQHRRAFLFRGCIVRFMLRPVCLPSPPDWLRHR